MRQELRDNERRSELIQIRVNVEQKAMIREDAKKQQRSVSEYMLWLANREHGKNGG